MIHTVDVVDKKLYNKQIKIKYTSKCYYCHLRKSCQMTV